ncbi:MAG: RdgB/HAM1 family non-canonical purine NTP pyrophosphatase [Caldilineaceae bacterium SB0664_bin_22]|nr:RdgB/HAM1 family non-canonical purine NTP pyrophosphatase [Caldilineaceae bacterium SB0664_bin_22]
MLVASGNPGKVKVLRGYLDGLPRELRFLTDFPDIPEVAETGTTFEENAVLKAKGYAQASGLQTLADDSGLEVEALGQAPGVYSARYGGSGLSDRDRCDLLLRNLADTGDAARRARFVCVVAVALPSGETELFRGERMGCIAECMKGEYGFGYDPVFTPEGHARTYAQMEPSYKSGISHRQAAMAAARAFLLGK